MAALFSHAGGAIEIADPSVIHGVDGNIEPYTADMRPYAEWSVLSHTSRIKPVKDLQELIDLAFHCAETVDDVDEVERLIDGICRFAGERPADFADRVAPLIHRMNQRGSSHSGLATALPGVAESMRSFVLTWAMGELRGSHQQDLSYYSREDAFVPMIAFLHQVARQVHRGEPMQLLSAATHRGGWIDPLVWIERLRHMSENGVVEDTMDFRLSLLRLAPDNRDEALAKAETLTGEAARLARFALGGDEVPARGEQKHYAAWLTAARARDPMADWSELLAPLNINDPWPGGAVPPTYRWHIETKAEKHHDMRWKTASLHVGIEPADGNSGASASSQGGFFNMARLLDRKKKIGWEGMPTAAICQQQSRVKYDWNGDLNTTWVAQWLGYIWPQNPAYASYRGAKKLMQRIDESASNWTPAHGFFKPLFVRGRPWGDAGHLVLAMGLIGKDADAKALAVDALIEGIEARQFDQALFADVMARLSEGGWVKYNRLAETLKQASQASPIHAGAIGAALQNWLPDFDLSQRGAFHILEVLLEARAFSPQPLSREVRTALEQLKGKAKAAKLAQQILS